MKNMKIINIFIFMRPIKIWQNFTQKSFFKKWLQKM